MILLPHLRDSNLPECVTFIHLKCFHQPSEKQVATDILFILVSFLFLTIRNLIFFLVHLAMHLKQCLLQFLQHFQVVRGWVTLLLKFLEFKVPMFSHFLKFNHKVVKYLFYFVFRTHHFYLLMALLLIK